MKWRKRLAVSTIIANVLIAALVLTLGTVAVIWGTSQFMSVQGGAEVYFLTRGEALRERFIIEDVWFGKPPNDNALNVSVRNVGKIDLTVVSVYVSNVSAVTPAVSSQFTLSQPVLVGQLVQLGPLTLPSGAFQKDATYQIIVTTSRGGKVVQNFLNWRA